MILSSEQIERAVNERVDAVQVIRDLADTALHLYDENERLREALRTLAEAGVLALRTGEVETLARKALADAGVTGEEFPEGNEGAT
jgi:hypothetical protein